MMYSLFCAGFIVFIFQNKFYIESKLNRDLRDDLMKLFADHVAEKHVNTLMREYLDMDVGTALTNDFIPS